MTERLTKEYELIQAKIDKIGEFKFKVRGWLITILSALLAGVVSNQIPLEYSPIIILILFIFHFLEVEQAELGTILANRALVLEYAIGILTLEEKNETKKSILSRKALEDVGMSPRVAVIMRNRARLKFWKLLRRMFIFNPNKLYYLIYFLAVLTTVTKYYFEHNTLRSSSEKESNTEVIINNTTQPSIMKEDVQIEGIKEEMYSLVSQIDYGDVSEINQYWKSLGDALLKLDHDGWKKPKHGSEVSEILKSMSFAKTGKIAILAGKMEALSAKGSSSSLDEDSLRQLQSFAIDFERQFDHLLVDLEK